VKYLFELDILKSVESGEWESKGDTTERTGGVTH